jgi:hypothetical protein
LHVDVELEYKLTLYGSVPPDKLTVSVVDAPEVIVVGDAANEADKSGGIVVVDVVVVEVLVDVVETEDVEVPVVVTDVEVDDVVDAVVVLK